MRQLLIISFLVSAQFVSLAQWDTKDPVQFQKELDAWYANPETSALPDAELENFYGLDFYPIREEFTVVAKFTRTKREKKVKVATSTSRQAIIRKYGELSFTLEGKEFRLSIYERFPKQKNGYDDYFTLAFTDETSGETTYGGGRYLGFREKDLQGEAVVLDFNLAYNPSCAYSPMYSCIIPPPENHISIEVKAGVKDWK